MKGPRAFVTIAAVCSLLGTVQAAVPEELNGRLTFAGVTLRGQTDATSSSVGAMHFIAESKRLSASWDLRADGIFVNWTRVERTGVGSSPNDPEESLANTGPPQRRSGERVYVKSQLTTQVEVASANALIIPQDVTLDVEYFGELDAQPASEEKWTVGPFSNRSVGAGQFEEQLIHSHTTKAGEPLLRTRGEFRATLNGNFTIYIWGTNVTVSETGQDPESYRSGAWYENATGTQIGPRGAVRTDYRQLLRIEASGAKMHVQQRAGLGQWVAREASPTTGGTAIMESTTGVLESSRNSYVARGDLVRIDGTMTQLLSQHSVSPPRLASAFTASAANVNLAPSMTTTTIPSPWSVAGWVAAAILLFASGAGGYVWWRREAPLRSMGVADRMAKLVSTNPAVAERKLRARLRRHPDDFDLIVLHAQSYLELGWYKELVKDFEPLARRGSRVGPILSFILARAFARLKRASKTVSCLEVAVLEPALKEQIMQDPELHRFLASPRRAVSSRGASQTGYA